MAELGVVEVPRPEGDSSPVREESSALGLKDGGSSESPVSRQSVRRKTLRSATNRERLVKSTPKSPLMRMAEMRKGGLRGKALKQSGLKSSDLKSLKGAKGKGGRNLQILAYIPEGEVADVDLLEGKEGEGEFDGRVLGGEVAVIEDDRNAEDALNNRGSPTKKFEEGDLKLRSSIPAGDISDLALDLIAAQPLQEMDFVGEQVKQGVEVGIAAGKEDCTMEELSLQNGIGINKQPNDFSSPEFGEDFPPLSSEGLRIAKEKERTRGVGGKEPLKGMEYLSKGKMDKSKESQSNKGESSKWAGGKNPRVTSAEGVNFRGNSPFSFEPGKIKKMGCWVRVRGSLQSISLGQKLPS